MAWVGAHQANALLRDRWIPWHTCPFYPRRVDFIFTLSMSHDDQNLDVFVCTNARLMECTTAQTHHHTGFEPSQGFRAATKEATVKASAGPKMQVGNPGDRVPTII